jgi:hypothetical protein
MRILICAALTMSMLLAAPAAIAEPEEGPVGMKILDLVLVRPVSFVISLASTGVFIGSLPLTFPIGVSYDLGTSMVTVPWRYTSSRPYGNFEEYRDHRTVRGALIADAR